MSAKLYVVIWICNISDNTSCMELDTETEALEYIRKLVEDGVRVINFYEGRKIPIEIRTRPVISIDGKHRYEL